VHTVSGPTVEGGTILFEEGRIVAIGTEVAVPEEAERIAVGGKHVYPGLIAANTILGLVEIGAVKATQDHAEVGDIKPSVRAEVAVNPDSEQFPVARANGVALSLTVPSGGLISGTSALLMLDGWTWEDMTLKAPVGLHVRWPRMTVGRPPGVTKAEAEKQLKRRDAQIQKIRNAFSEARAYLKAKGAEAQESVPFHDTDVRWEAMGPALRKEIPVFVHANDLRQIQAAVSWAKEEGVRMVLVGGRDAWRAAELLKEKDIPVIVAGIHVVPRRRWEAYDAPFTNPLRLHETGVRFCIAGRGGYHRERNLPYQAATAAAYGLPKAEALKAVTLYPAQILGVSDRVGSLEVGRDATLMVTDGDPLEIRTQVERLYIQGRDVDLTSRHTQLYEKYRTKYRRLGLAGER